MARRQFFRSLAAIPFLALTNAAAAEPKKKLHIMMKSALGHGRRDARDDHIIAE